MIILWIVCAVFVLFALFTLAFNPKEFMEVSIILIFGVICVLIGFFAGYRYNSRKLQAIDVYRGKTTLKITYQDSIPVDSVVVFKTINNK